MQTSKAPQPQHIVICRPGYAECLAQEFTDLFGISSQEVSSAAISVEESLKLPSIKDTIFARQFLPRSIGLTGLTADAAAEVIFARLIVLAKRANREQGVWKLQAFASDDDDALAYALQVEKSLKKLIRAKSQELASKFENFKESLATDDLESTAKSKEKAASDFIVQIWAATKEQIYFSGASVATGISEFPGGVQRMKKIPGAPSRSASKIAEALTYFPKQPTKGQTGVDLGAAPGGWTYVMAYWGVDMTAVDHAELKLPKLSANKGKIAHLKENGLTFAPEVNVDWLCCDMVIGANQTLEVLKNWTKAGKTRNFIVNIKLPQNNPWPSIEHVLKAITTLRESKIWQKVIVRQLFHDRNEVTIMGYK